MNFPLGGHVNSLWENTTETFPYFGAKKFEIREWLLQNTHFRELSADPVVLVTSSSKRKGVWDLGLPTLMGYSFLYAFTGERSHVLQFFLSLELSTHKTRMPKRIFEGVKRRPLSERVSQTGFSFRWEIAELPWGQWPVASVHKSRIRKA